jgi:hypothetical protein
MAEFLDFNEICRNISIQSLLDYLNIPYTKKGSTLKCDYKGSLLVIDTNKNLFTNTKDKRISGGVINLFALINNKSLRDSASELKATFLKSEREPKRDLPNLELAYHPYLESLGISKESAELYEVGVVKSKSIFTGKIAIKTYDPYKNHTGYIAYDLKTKSWHFPQKFKRTLYNAHNICEPSITVLIPNPFDALYFMSKNLPWVTSLLGLSMTESQEESLKKYERIVLLHPEPDNIVLRLKHKCFIKAPILIKPLRDYSVEEIVSFV